MKPFALFTAVLTLALLPSNLGYAQSPAPAAPTVVAQAASPATESLAQTLKGKVPSGIELLEDLTLAKPGPDVPPQLAELSGVWIGEWRGKKTKAYMADQVYVFEKMAAESLNIFSAGIGRYQAPRGQSGTNAGQKWNFRFADVKPQTTTPDLVFLFPNGNTNQMRVVDGELHINLTTPKGIEWEGNFKKIQ